MRLAAILLVGAATFATAEAQTGPARVAFLPMPNTLPTLLFAPDSLAGTLLRPLAQPANAPGLPEVSPEPAGSALADSVGNEALALAQAAETVALPEPEAAPEPPVAPEAEAAVESPPPAPAPADPNVSTVTVIVENVESSEGVVNVALCDKGLSREGCKYFREVKASPGFVETEFDQIPPGTYAVVAYHDVNNNDRFDQFMKIPREPYALSSKAADELVPTWEDAALPIKSGENAVIIRLKRLGG